MEYIIYIATFIAIYLIIAESFNIILGFTGLFNLGHITFVGIGAYTTALMTLHGNSLWTGLLLGGLLASVGGLILALPTMRLRKHYFAIATLGFTYIFFAVAINWTNLTRGPLGLPGILRPETPINSIIQSPNFAFFILVTILSLICNFIIYRIGSSPFGRILETIREDDIAAETIGKNTAKFKLMAVMIGAFFAGIGGGLFAIFFRYIDPYNFALSEMVFILLMVILGGLGSFWGTIIGVILIVLLPEPLRLSNIHIFHELILITVGTIFLIKNPYPQKKIIKILPFVLFFLIEFGLILIKDKNFILSQAAEFLPLFIITIIALGILTTWQETKKLSYYCIAVYIGGILSLLSTNMLFDNLPASTVGPLRQILFALLFIIIMIYHPQGFFGKKITQ